MRIEKLIETETAPIMDVIIYNNGDMYILRYETIENYRSVAVLCQSSLENYLYFNTDYMTNIYFTIFFENESYKVSCGEGSYGSEGVISLFDKIKNEYIWLLHLEYSNPFEKVEIIENEIIAVNNNKEVWKFPINILAK